MFSAREPAEVGSISGMTAECAIHVLHMRKHCVHGVGKRPGLRAREPDIEDIRAEILRKVAALKGHDAQRLESDREEWALRRGSGQARRQGDPGAFRR